MLLPPDLRDWVPEDDMVHFVIEAVDRMPLRLEDFAVNRRGTGSEQYSPRTVTDPRSVTMQTKMRGEEARRRYAKRKQTVEPVFGIIKSVMCFRNFRLRGLAQVSLEWTLATLAYNVKRLYALRELATSS